MTKLVVPPTPGDLLRQFQPRFRQVQLVPKGFGAGDRIDKNHFIFTLKHPEFKGEIHPNYYRNGAEQGCVLFDVKAGKFDFDFRYDSSNPLSVDEQFQTAVGEAILNDPLSFVFCVKHKPGHDIASVLEGKEPEILLTWAGDHINVPGLILPQQLQAKSWHFFIPSETEEYTALALALQLQQQQAKLRDARSLGGATQNDIERLSSCLSDALQKVA